jgi:hypothetical protein
MGGVPRIAALDAANEQATKELASLLDSDEAKQALANVDRDDAAFDAVDRESLRRSHTETVNNVEERDGSRDLYTSKVVSSLQDLQTSTHALAATLKKGANDAVVRSRVDAAGSVRLILIITGIALIAAALIAIWITLGMRLLLERWASSPATASPTCRTRCAPWPAGT